MDRGAWRVTVHGVMKSWARLTDFTFTFHFDSLEKEMATHSSVLVPQVGLRLIQGAPDAGKCELGRAGEWFNAASQGL